MPADLLKDLFLPLMIVFGTVAILFAGRGLTFRLLRRWADSTETRIGDLIVATFKTPSVYWCISIGLIVGLEVSELPQKYVLYIHAAIHVIIILSITIATANLFSSMLSSYIRKKDVSIPGTGIVFGVVKGAVLIVGMLIILGSLGVSITPLITALGVGGLAVALALQETLSNLFAGLHIIASGQVKPGDYVKLSTGEEGYVTDITWRNTTIRALSNSLIIVPNSKFATSIIINYELPDREFAISIPVTVSYGSDLEKVEQVTIDAAKEVMAHIEGGVPGFEPTIRYSGFGELGIQFGVNLRARGFIDQYTVRHEFIKLLYNRFREGGISLPYPVSRVQSIEERPQVKPFN